MRPAGIPKTSGILPRRIFVFLWVFHKLVITPLQVFGKGISWLDYTTATASGHAAASTDSFWFIVPQGVVRFAKQFPARTLGGVTLFVEDDLRDAFFVGVAVVVDCLFTFNQPVDSDSSGFLAIMELPKLSWKPRREAR